MPCSNLEKPRTSVRGPSSSRSQRGTSPVRARGSGRRGSDELDRRPRSVPARAEPANWLFDDETWRTKYFDALETTIDAYDPDLFAHRIDTFWAQVKDEAHADPFLAFGETPYNSLKTRIRQRRAFLNEWIACERDPMPDTDADGDGYRWCRECADSNPFVYPGAEEICGDAVDDDCDGTPDDGCPAPAPTPMTTPTAGP